MSVKQTTAKTVLEVLEWVETKQHHIADATDKAFLVLTGYRHKIRIPNEISAIACRYIEPARDPFDTRMYRAIPYGIHLLKKAGKLDAIREIQKHRSVRNS